MKSATLKIVVAVYVTVMDVAVIGFCGPLLWKVWDCVYWARLGLLVLAGGITFSLMDIWARAIAVTHGSANTQKSHELELFSSPGAMEGADV